MRTCPRCRGAGLVGDYQPNPKGDFIGPNLRKARIQSGLSTHCLAEKIGSSRGSIICLESNLRPASEIFQGRLEIALGLPSGTLRAGARCLELAEYFFDGIKSAGRDDVQNLAVAIQELVEEHVSVVEEFVE